MVLFSVLTHFFSIVHKLVLVTSTLIRLGGPDSLCRGAFQILSSIHDTRFPHDQRGLYTFKSFTIYVWDYYNEYTYKVYKFVQQSVFGENQRSQTCSE